MKKILVIVLALAILLCGCTMSLESNKQFGSGGLVGPNESYPGTSQNVIPATSGGVDSSGDELPPLPPE